MNQRNGKQYELAGFGQHAHFAGVRADLIELRPWLKDFPVCQALGQHQLLHVGVARISAPVGLTLTVQHSTCLVASFGGEGRVRVDGHWHRCREGTGCLLPAQALDIFPDGAGKLWEFCWACYEQLPEQRPASGPAAPRIARFDPQPLRCAIEGLTYECSREAVPTDVQHWADLIQSYVMRFVHPQDGDERLAQLWQRVTAQLEADWSLARLAQEAGYSHGHLGRLCRRQLRRSPMHHVTYLRMRRAADLLTTTNLKIEAVAEVVGYANPFVFSNAFTRCFGWRPSDYRRKHHQPAMPAAAAANGHRPLQGP